MEQKKRGFNVQDQVLNASRRETLPLTFHLRNGEKFEGLVFKFDPFTILVKSEKHGIKLVYKSALAVIDIPIELDI